ncbi:hypothetical protein G7046_g6754 [Stylonectria norvegica]|nr:hypothetical protein G7046_g6754 [Stylonectria norvegica]
MINGVFAETEKGGAAMSDRDAQRDQSVPTESSRCRNGRGLHHTLAAQTQVDELAEECGENRPEDTKVILSITTLAELVSHPTSGEYHPTRLLVSYMNYNFEFAQANRVSLCREYECYE